MMDKKYSQYKEKMENEVVSSKGHNFAVGDHVLLRQRKVNKWSTLYEPVFYTVKKSMDLLLLQDVLQTAERFQRDASHAVQKCKCQENADDGSHEHEDWRETGLMSASNMKDQPIFQRMLSRRFTWTTRTRDERETTTEPVQEDPTKQSGGSGRQQEEGAKAVNCQEVGMSSPASGDTS